MSFLVLRTSAAASDTTPDAFTFTDQTGVAVSTTITSAAITVAGINAAASISVSNGTYDINSSGSFTASSGTVNNGDTVRARHTSSGSNSTAVDTIVTIGGVSDTFTSTTVSSGTTADKYVSSTGSNGAAGTLGAPYATIAFALGVISAGQSVGVLSNLSENLAWNSLSGGTSGSATHKIVKAITPGYVITGTTGGTQANSNLTFEDLVFNVGTGEGSAQDAGKLIFNRCGFTGGGGTSSGNVVQWVSGSNQSYHGCYWDGTGGRYCIVVFNVDNVLMNECVFRTQANVWGPAGSNPTGGCTIYSSTNIDAINCIAVDCLNQGNGSEWLGGFNLVANVGNQTGVTLRQCIVRFLDGAGLIGMQFDGANSMTAAVTDCASVDCEYGAVVGTHLTGSSTITFTGGEYSGNNFNGIADFGSSASVANTVNTASNGAANFNGISGSGNTTNALNMATRTASWKRYGTTYGLLRGETGWNTATASNVFPFPNESYLRTKLAAVSTRGFCGGSFTLSTYIQS